MVLPAATARTQTEFQEGLDETHVIRTVGEFHAFQAKKTRTSGLTLVDIDLSGISQHEWNSFEWNKTRIWGCKLPSYATCAEMAARGSQVIPQTGDAPFKTFRAFMYRQRELRDIDGDCSAFARSVSRRSSLVGAVYSAIHDKTLMHALNAFLHEKTAVGVMGGHAVQRNHQSYADCVWLGYKLARAGFVVATGGGPGAMEAANLGAYLHQEDELNVQSAIDLISRTNDPAAILARYGEPDGAPSISIPTWKYAHEPSNVFASWVAKMFNDPLREAIIIECTTGGLIFTPGSAGTRQEIFQAANLNHYSLPDKNFSPMVFYDKGFWDETGLVQRLVELSKDATFKDAIIVEDNAGKVVQYLVNFRDNRLQMDYQI